ncbi:MAG: tetratricopeptide repeat protein [Cyanobacteriota/Melainabacteria group bacterium]
MKLRQSRVLHMLLLAVISSTFLFACADVKPLSFSLDSKKTWEDLVAEGQAALSAGKIPAAEAAFSEAVEKCSEKFGEDDARTGTCVGYLAELYRNQQEWLKAGKAYKRWMSITWIKTTPPESNSKLFAKAIKRFVTKIKQYRSLEE